MKVIHCITSRDNNRGGTAEYSRLVIASLKYQAKCFMNTSYYSYENR